MMTKLFRRWLPGTTLAVWGAILLHFFFSKRIDALLHPMFRPYVLVAGIVLVLMAGVFLLFPADTSCCSAAECGHSLSRKNSGKLLTFLVLILPITVAAFVSPDSFGRTMIENRRIDVDGSSLGARPRSNVTQSPAPVAAPSQHAPAATSPPIPSAPGQEQVPDYIQRSPEGNILVEVLDLLYAAQDNVLRKDFEGKTVELVGQLMPDKTSGDAKVKRFKAVRMFMTCCAADARPVATVVEVDALPEFPEMTWVKIVGTSTFPLEKGRRTAVLKAAKVEKTNPPEETMLY